MPWRGPEYAGELPSLGPLFCEWVEEHLVVPAGPLYGQPFIFTDEQWEFFHRFYALDPKTGRSIYRRGVRRGAKGKGKSPEGAAWLLAEFCGPVLFDGWDAHGEPVGRAWDNPLCQVVAAAEDQTGNLYDVLIVMGQESDLVEEEGIDFGKTRIEFFGTRPGKIEPVTSSAGAREGAPVTAAVLEETHLWMEAGGGHKLAAVMRRNVAKTGGRSYEVTNAPAMGERSVAELSLEAADEGQPGLLYDAVEAPWVEDPKNPDCRDELLEALAVAYGEASTELGGWVDLERIYEECMDAETSISDVRRFYLNQAVKSEKRAFSIDEFKVLKDEDREVPDDVPYILMFDGARTRDCAVLTAWALTEGKPHHVNVKVWVRPDNASDNYEHPRGEFKRTAREFIADNNVVLFAYDSSFHELSGVYDEWIDEYDEFDGKRTGLMVEYPTASGRRMDQAIRRVKEDMHEGLFTHDGDPTVQAHLGNCIEETSRGGYKILAKEKDSAKIDAAVTLVFGYDLVAMGRLAAAEKSKSLEPYLELI